MKTTHPIAGNQFAAKAPGGLPARINFACMSPLKEKAERLAADLEMKPAELYRQAIQEFIDRHQSG